MTIFAEFYADAVRARPYRHVVTPSGLWLIPEGQPVNPGDLDRAFDAIRGEHVLPRQEAR